MSRSKTLWIAAGVFVACCAVLAVKTVGTSHGEINERLRLSVRLVDAKNGQPVGGAVVATVAFKDSIGRDYVETLLTAARKNIGSQDLWRYPVAAALSDADGNTTIETSVYVTRSWVLSVQVTEELHLPEALLVERGGRRTAVSIDPGSRIRAGRTPDTWEVELGTISVP